jgi:hypothetical protein
MASPLKTGKQPVKLTPPPVSGSRIRRDPPPVVKEKIVLDPEDRDQRDVILGVLTFALAMFVIIFAFGNYSGWTWGDHKVELKFDV